MSWSTVLTAMDHASIESCPRERLPETASRSQALLGRQRSDERRQGQGMGHRGVDTKGRKRSVQNRTTSCSLFLDSLPSLPHLFSTKASLIQQ